MYRVILSMVKSKGELNDMMKRITIGCLLLILTTAVGLKADEPTIHDSAGTLGAAFLNIEAGSRPVGMGGAFAGLADDVNSLFYNPAGLTSVDYRELTAMQNFWLAGINNESIGYAQRVPFGGEKGVIGLSFLGAFSEIEARSGQSDEPERTFTASSFALGLSYGHELATGVSLGGTMKFINQDFDTEDSTGFAGDAGVLLVSDRFSAGASLQNLGSLSSEESLPVTFRAGGAIHLIAVEETEVVAEVAGEAPSEGTVPPAPEETTPPTTETELVPILTLATDVNVPLSKELKVAGHTTIHLGLEGWFYDKLALRAGYSFDGKTENLTNKRFTAGIGLRAWGTSSLENVNFQFDYAFVPDNDLGNIHRISFISRF